jgi:2-oxoisovalerate dehydrogenase E2 component (dihydrolipoyl transacylase)
VAPEEPAAPAPEPLAVQNKTAHEADAPDAAPQSAGDLRGRYSPAVRRLAEDRHINPDTVPGSGAGGRVTRDDILHAVQPAPSSPERLIAQSVPVPVQETAASPREIPKAAPTGPISQSPAAAAAVIDAEDQIVPLSSIRKVIADRMMRSKTTVPHAWLMMEVDVSSLVALRQSLKEEFKQREGTSLTYMPFMLHAVVQALKAVPEMNAQWNGDSIVLKKHVNIGMATATDKGLIVPIIKDADQKNIAGLARASQDLVKRARASRLTMDDLTGGTFTVDNTGAIGTVLTYPIINAPEAGIITMEAIVKRPVVIQDMVAVRSMMNVCTSFDHRVVDGAEAGRFVQLIKQNLESIGPSTSVY